VVPQNSDQLDESATYIRQVIAMDTTNSLP
jgi:hypothetical protein